VRISQNYFLKTRSSKQPIEEISGYEIIPLHPLNPRSKQGLKKKETLFSSLMGKSKRRGVLPNLRTHEEIAYSCRRRRSVSLMRRTCAPCSYCPTCRSRGTGGGGGGGPCRRRDTTPAQLSPPHAEAQPPRPQPICPLSFVLCLYLLIGRKGMDRSLVYRLRS
jgi:hypothetical protein